jgi:hypothetical protein
VTDVTTGQGQDEARLSAADEQLLRELTERARAGGLKLTGEGGLLGQLTKMVVEGALEGELDDHLGYEKNDPAGRNGGNSRNGYRGKTVLTDAGPVEISVPRDRDASFEPKIVAKRQRRLTGVDAMVISLSAKGLTHGEIITLPEFEDRGRAEVEPNGYESLLDTGYHPATDPGWKVVARAEFLLKLQHRLPYNPIGHNCEIIAKPLRQLELDRELPGPPLVRPQGRCRRHAPPRHRRLLRLWLATPALVGPRHRRLDGWRPGRDLHLQRSDPAALERDPRRLAGPRADA